MQAVFYISAAGIAFIMSSSKSTQFLSSSTVQWSETFANLEKKMRYILYGNLVAINSSKESLTCRSVKFQKIFPKVKPTGPVRESNQGPLAPIARIAPLDQQAGHNYDRQEEGIYRCHKSRWQITCATTYHGETSVIGPLIRVALRRILQVSMTTSLTQGSWI